MGRVTAGEGRTSGQGKGTGMGMGNAHAHVYGQGHGHGRNNGRRVRLFCPCLRGVNVPVNSTAENVTSNTEYFLDHERLEVYKLAREHARQSHRLLQLLPHGRADIADQYRRASLSIPLNLAEGGGEYAPAEKARFYRIAKRSATECAAVLDHLVDLQMLPESELRIAKALLRRIVSALVKLILSTERMSATRDVAPAHAHAPKRVRVR